MMEFKDRLADALRVSDVNKGELAERVGRQASAVSNWLSGDRTPDAEVLRQIADLLGVPGLWLATGAGPLPAKLRDEELRRLASVTWAARRVPIDGGRLGGNPALFAIRPTLQRLIREALQNSTDVPLGGGPVAVDVRLLGLTGAARAAFLEALRWDVIHRHLKASVEDAEDQQVATALKEGMAIDEGGELLVLLIADYNTTGLTGPETGKGNFAALTRDTLFSNKGGSATAGGSYGVGKFTALAGSAINTVIYLSDLSVPEDGHSRGRLLGRSELVWRHDPDGGRDCDGAMWLGQTDGPAPEKADSHWAEGDDLLVSGMRMTRRPDTSGTTLAIVGLRDLNADETRTPAQMVDELRDEAARSFFAAIETGGLEINVDYLQLDDAPDGPDPLPGSGAAVRPEHVSVTAALVDALRKHDEDDVRDELVDDGEVVRVGVPLEVPARRDGAHGAFVHEATLLIRRATADEVDTPAAQEAIGRVALMRGRRMVIKSLDARRTVVGARPFQAVLLAGEAAGESDEHTWAEEFLRRAEPPAHDDWELTETVRHVYKSGAGRRLRDFEAAIRKAVHVAVIREPDLPPGGPRDLSRRFRFGEPPAPPERAPRLIIDEKSLRADGAWEITGTIRVRTDKARTLRGTPKLVFAGETGKRSVVKWTEITPLRDCAVDETTKALTIPAGKRSARFRGVTDPASHPIRSDDGAVAVLFTVEETA